MSSIGTNSEDLVLNADGSGNDVIIQSDGSTVVTVDGSQSSVGIGTATPTGNAKLHIYNGASGQASSSNNTELTIENSSNTGIQFLTPNTAVSGIWFGDPDNKEIGRMYYTHSEDSLKIFTDSTERLRIDSDGIKFNADTAAANALDDYEEGTWTPAVTGSSGAPSSVTYTTSPAGKYTRVGRVVTISFYLHVNTITGGSGHFHLTGVPFSSIGSNEGLGTGSVNLYMVDEPDLTDPTIYVDSTYIRVMCSTGGSGALDDNSWTTAALSSFNGSAVRGSITYQAT
jgi:hypothetical protein